MIADLYADDRGGRVDSRFCGNDGRGVELIADIYLTFLVGYNNVDLEWRRESSV